jgi:lipoyl(octanoyl) transferase
MINIQIIENIDYDSALKLQVEEKERVRSGHSKGSIFLLEHSPSVITFGRHADQNNLLVRKDFIEGRGYQVRQVSRGGDITVHEPGQVVGYIVLPLRSSSVRTFVENIMHTIQNSLVQGFGLETEYIEDKAGLWIGNKKICSVGFDLRGRVSMHGFALNVNNTLEGFSYVVPCGLTGVSMTTVSKEIRMDVKTTDIKLLLAEAFNQLSNNYLKL